MRTSQGRLIIDFITPICIQWAKSICRRGKKEILTLGNSHWPDTAIVFHTYNLIKLSQQPYEVGANIAYTHEETSQGEVK